MKIRLIYKKPIEDFHFCHRGTCDVLSRLSERKPIKGIVLYNDIDRLIKNFNTCTNTISIRAEATAPEKTPTEKIKFFERRDHRQASPRQILRLKKKKKKKKRKKKVATPHLHGASAIRRPRPRPRPRSRPRPPDALNVILRVNRCLDGIG